MIECDLCDGEMVRIDYLPKARGTVWMCTNCRHEQNLGPINHVVLMHPNMVACLACGDHYAWQPPVPMGLYVAGNEAYGYDHRLCFERQQEERAELLGLLARRVVPASGLIPLPPAE